MNKKVFTTMLILVIAFLCGMYIFKIFFPQEFVMSVENERIVAIGKYIDGHTWAFCVMGTVTSFITFWLYTCAVCQKKYLNWVECLIVLGVTLLSMGLNFVAPKFVGVLGYMLFIILPVLFGCTNAKPIALVFSVHVTAQYLSLQIRNLPMYIAYYNSLSFMLMTCEVYFWLFLFYLIYNYKEV